MIYRLLNRLFGWDYVAWSNSADQGVGRVHSEPETGRVWYWRYRSTSCADLVTSADQVIWLTCPPSKYLGEVVDEDGGTP